MDTSADADTAAAAAVTKKTFATRISDGVAKRPQTALAAIVILVMIVIIMYIYYNGIFKIGPFADNKCKSKDSMSTGAEKTPSAGTKPSAENTATVEKKEPDKKKEPVEEEDDAETKQLIESLKS